ncbi:MAG: hypothetical protein NTW99_04090, partial [Chloroflexi bacterium]|nr:hypothetical protein [Chloroflexota bacterium]
LLEPERERKPAERALSPKTDPFPAGKGQFEVFSFERAFSGKELFDCPRDAHIETDGNLPIFRLKRGELIKDEDGNAQFNIDRTAFERTDSLKVPWWLGEQVTDTVWIKKELELKNPETDKAALMFFYEIQAHYPRKGGYWSVAGGSQSPLHVIINGTELPPVKPDIGYRSRTEDWRQVDFPPGLLKKGINTVVVHAEKGGDWRFAYENSVSPNRSAKSMDSGKTWDYNRLGENRNENGEYLVRFLLDRCHEQGMVWSAPIALWEKDGMRAFSTMRLTGTGLGKLLQAFLSAARKGDYVAINAYLPRNPDMAVALAELRFIIRAKTGCATTVGFGPRFLHSTGQLHKGGPDSGLFLQITAEPVEDLEIPGQGMSFGTLERAQALGDYEALAARGRRILRLNLPSPKAVRLLVNSLK